MNDTIRTLLERRSVRSYRPDAVEEEKLQAILEAGLYAPSAMALQSVTLVAVEDRATRDALERANAAIQGNPSGKPFYGAPVAVAVLTDPEATTATVTLERTLDDVTLQGEIEGISIDRDKNQMLISYNRGSQIVLGMVRGFYEGYEEEIHEIFVYDRS